MKICLQDDIRKIHKKVSTYVYTVLLVAPEILSTLSPDVRDALPLWAKTGISFAAVAGITNKLVKVQRKKNVDNSSTS